MEKFERLKIIRLLSGYTQAELAKMVQMPQASIAVMEKGKYGVAGETGFIIASALKVPFDYLYAGFPPVDYKDPIVWIPIPPTRSQHFQSMINDLKALFPLFLSENGFNATITGAMSDGTTVFLIGRVTNINAQREMDITCLLVAEKRLVDVFRNAFITSGVEITTELSTLTIDSFLINQFDSVLHGLRLKFNSVKLRNKLAEARNRKEREETESKSELSIIELQTIFKLILNETKDLKLSDDVLTNLLELFVRLCQLGGKSVKNRIDPTFIRLETRKILDSMGVERINKRLI